MALSRIAVGMLETRALPMVPSLGTVVSLGVAKVMTPRGQTTCREYFKALGFRRVVTLDVSEWEGCDVVADLNWPLPEELCRVADLVLDPGTLEHVFDIAQALANVHKLLRLGGVAYHHSPVSMVDHGFYNLCPAFFHDAYEHNDYRPVRCWVHNVGVAGLADVHEWRYDPQRTHTLGRGRHVMEVIARKCSDVLFRYPQQRRYVEGKWHDH